MTVATRPQSQLKVESLGDGRYHVSGGAEPHVVTIHPNGPLCDCKDFKFGKRRGVSCKHIERVTAAQATGELIPPAADVPGLGAGGPGLDSAAPWPDPLPDSGDAPRLGGVEALMQAKVAPALDAAAEHFPASARQDVVGSIAGGRAVASRADDDERAVLCAILLANIVPAAVRDRLSPDVFDRLGHQLLYKAMVALTLRGEPVDPLTLRASLDGDLERAGGMEYIATLIDVVPTAAHIETHAGLVMEHARRRAIARVGRQLAEAEAGVSLERLREAVHDAQGLLEDQGGRARFQLLSVDELLALTPPAWLLDRHVPEGGLVEIFGAPGSGKTFLSLAMSLSIAAGRPWLDHAARAGRVVYCAAEGSSGLGKRVRTYCDAHEITDLTGMQFIREAVNLAEPRDVDTLLARSGQDPPPALFVFDTLARCMVGHDENQAMDMGLVIAAADRIRQRTGAAVLVVHHTTKDGQVSRGSSALEGACDVAFKLENDDGMLTLKAAKQHKDAPPIAEVQLRLVAAGESCLIEPADAVSAFGAMQKMDRLALEALNAIAIGEGATHGEWRDAATETRHGMVSMSRATFSRVRKRLLLAGLIQTTAKGKRYLLSGKGISACAVS